MFSALSLFPQVASFSLYLSVLCWWLFLTVNPWVFLLAYEVGTIKDDRMFLVMSGWLDYFVTGLQMSVIMGLFSWADLFSQRGIFWSQVWLPYSEQENEAGGHTTQHVDFYLTYLFSKWTHFSGAWCPCVFWLRGQTLGFWHLLLIKPFHLPSGAPLFYGGPLNLGASEVL